MPVLRDDFPFRDIIQEFLEDYVSCTTNWYVPHTRALTDENVRACADVLYTIFDAFLEEKWNTETQDQILARLREENVLDPYQEGDPYDRTALVRIWKKLLETLGFLWVQADKEIMLTDAGVDLIGARGEEDGDLRRIVSEQIGKLQYPNPSLATSYAGDFEGILPHLFLLQLLNDVGPISYREFDLFVNLASSQEDMPRIIRYIETWRGLNEEQKGEVQDIVDRVPDPDNAGQLALDEEMLELEPRARGTRANKISNVASYQRSFFTYPSYVESDSGESLIRIVDEDQVKEVIEAVAEDLKITKFDTLEDWISYFGDPEQRPTWFTYVSFQVEVAESEEEAEEAVDRHRDQLTDEQEDEVEQRRIEKGIEDFYVQHLYAIEDGLELVDDGRQFRTPIGRMDLLCQDEDGSYVVVEIKADEASDSVFGQIQRYMGWVHRNVEDGRYNVRGIILARQFGEKARYSRIGLLRDDYDEIITFKQHGLYAEDT